MLGDAAGRDGDHGDTDLGGQMPDPVHDLPAYLLGQACVDGAAQAPRVQGPQVLDIDRCRTGGDGLVHCPSGSRPGEGVVEVRPAGGHGADLVAQDLVLVGQVVRGVCGDEALIVVGLGVQALGQAAQAVLLGQDTGGTEHAAATEGGDRSAAVESGGPGTQQCVQFRPQSTPSATVCPIRAVFGTSWEHAGQGGTHASVWSLPSPRRTIAWPAGSPGRISRVLLVVPDDGRTSRSGVTPVTVRHVGARRTTRPGGAKEPRGARPSRRGTA